MNLKGLKGYVSDIVLNDWPQWLTYHSMYHIMDVYQKVGEIAEREGVSEKDLTLLRAAALLHDIGYRVQGVGHEAISCDEARKVLPDFGFGQDDIEVICGMIMATAVPQKPKNLLEQIICDADLDYLGRDDYWEIGQRLYEEMTHSGAIRNKAEWRELQISFLSNHGYFTETAIDQRSAKKAAHLQKLQEEAA